jgi:hypothetical protein
MVYLAGNVVLVVYSATNEIQLIGRRLNLQKKTEKTVKFQSI